ncbi:MAG: TetR/AcrR family transcriptional regulator [Mycobacteriales bacterium]
MRLVTSAARRSRGRPSLEQAALLDSDVQQAALRLFLEHGYDGTSMDAIAGAAGTTKASLYARFPSKEAVFTAVLDWAVGRPDWPVPEDKVPDLDDLEGALRAVASAAVRRALHPEMVQLSRVAVAHAARFPDLARRTHAAGVWPRRQLVVDLLSRHSEAGTIVADEPEALAELFLGMVAGVPARLASFGVVRDVRSQAHHTELAVQLFLRGLLRSSPAHPRSGR